MSSTLKKSLQAPPWDQPIELPEIRSSPHQRGIEVCEWKALAMLDDRLEMAGSSSSNSIALLRHLHTHMNSIMSPILYVAIDDPFMLVAV